MANDMGTGVDGRSCGLCNATRQRLANYRTLFQVPEIMTTPGIYNHTIGAHLRAYTAPSAGLTVKDLQPHHYVTYSLNS